MRQDQVLTMLLGLNIQGMRKNELQTMLHELDRGNAAHFCYHSLAAKIAELAQDPKHDALLKRIANICIRKGAPYNTPAGLRQSFSGIDREGKLPMPRFRSHLQSVVAGLDKTELSGLEAHYRLVENKADVARFVEELFAIQARKPAQLDRVASPASPAATAQPAGPLGAAEPGRSGREPDLLADRTVAVTQIQQKQIAQLKEDNVTLQKENKELQQRISQLERLIRK